MAKVLRKTDPSVDALATAINDLKAFVMSQHRLAVADGLANKAAVAAYVQPSLVDAGAHNDQNERPLVAAASTSLATSIAAVNEMLAWYAFHMDDTAAHKVVGVALASYVPATDLASAIARANDIKAKYNTHRQSTTYHYTADAANPITSSDATIQSDLNTLLVELKADLNLHGASGPAAASIRAVSA